MASVIAFLPRTERGYQILDELELRFEIWPLQMLPDGTRRYQVDDEREMLSGLIRSSANSTEDGGTT